MKKQQCFTEVNPKNAVFCCNMAMDISTLYRISFFFGRSAGDGTFTPIVWQQQGARIRHYLLEKVRVCEQQARKRTRRCRCWDAIKAP